MPTGRSGASSAPRAKKSFYDHTLFVVMGDHGARVYGAATIPLASYEVPILMVAPGLLPADARIDTLASSLDLPPTILSILGLAYPSRFFGQDLLHTPPENGRALLVHNGDIALMRNGQIAVLGLRQQVDVYDVDRASGAFRRDQLAHSVSSRGLVDDAIAYFQSADHLVRSGGYGLAVAEVGPALAPDPPAALLLAAGGRERPEKHPL